MCMVCIVSTRSCIREHMHLGAGGLGCIGWQEKPWEVDTYFTLLLLHITSKSPPFFNMSSIDVQTH